MGYFATGLICFALGMIFTLAVIRNNRDKAKKAIDKL